MKKEQIMPIVALVVGATIGSGGIWQYESYKLDEAKSKLDEITRLADIRKQQLQTLREIEELTNKYLALKDCESKRSLQGTNLLSELKLLRDSYNATEDSLAKLEDRKPIETYAFIDKCQP